MSGQFTLVADDYGLSPGVSAGIRVLLEAGRLTGTGCMTLFPEWPDEALRLKSLSSSATAEIGQHLTLTDFPSLTGFSLDGSGRMPRLPELLKALTLSNRHDAAIQAELDAQYRAFLEHWGTKPAYFDGHQHVHFLRPVRSWLRAYATQQAGRPLPWLRGRPASTYVAGLSLQAKVRFVDLLASGFDSGLRKAGFDVRGPLAGFYDWQKPDEFAPALDKWLRDVPENAVVMCHPGHVDDVLKSRDNLVEARAAEFDVLMSRAPVCRKG